MRFAAISISLLLAAPVLAGAQERNRPPPASATPAPAAPSAPTVRPDAPEPAQPSPALREARPPAPDATATRPPPTAPSRPPPLSPGPRPWGPPPPAYYPSPLWWGFGWGYGYYPLYPYYGEPMPGHPAAPSEPDHGVSSTLRVTGAVGPRDSGAVGLAFGFDGHHGGMDLAFDALAPNRGGVMGSTGLNGSQDSYGLASAHVAFPLLQGPSFRLRVLAGGSWLSVPASTYGPAADSFGFDVGASANLGLVGPLGLEGHARITPFPVQVVDLRAAVALRAGSFSLLGGYRVIDVEGDSRTGPAARFEGPGFGFGLIF